MRSPRLRTENLRDLAVGDRRLLFHVPTTSLFELDTVGGAVLDALGHGDRPEDLDGWARDDVRDALDSFERLDLLERAPVPAKRLPRPVQDDALTSLVLNVTTGCNLRCTYCYKEDLGRPAEARRLSAETAEAAIELLLSRSGRQRRVNLTFFGGEPLTNMEVIRHSVAYADRRAAETGKAIDYALTTNATLLDDGLIDYFDQHRFGLTISIDGPQPVHDRNRRGIGGAGTYAIVANRIDRLLGRYRSRPVGARVTLADGITDVVGIHRHLKDELGFAEVGFAPVTAGLPAGFGLNEAETRQVFDGLKALGERYRDAAIQGIDIGFSNLSRLLRAIDEGTGRILPCGAGLSLLAVDTEGAVHSCHRFVGTAVAPLGDLATGVDNAARDRFIDRAQTRAETFCSGCHARHLCAGGCYHESYTRHGDPFRPTDHYCDLMREWVDFGIAIYAQIMAGNPEFLGRHSEPRRANP